MTESLSGRVLGSYRIERELGAGGMGAVYLGRHVRTGRAYAVKVLLPEHSRRKDALARFRREAEALSALGHAHIVAIHDHDETDDGLVFLVMDHLEGQDLAQRLERVGRLSWQESVVLVDAVASALEAAHGLGMVHRDLKPSNVFLARASGAPGERPVLLDFGLARALESDDAASRVTATGTVLGTPAYMSPEQAQGRTLDGRSDVWALGVLLFEACAGQAPFVAPTLASTFVKILTAPTPTLESLGIDAPRALDECVARALEKSPEARFSNVAALRRALAPLVARAPHGPVVFGAASSSRSLGAPLAPTLASGSPAVLVGTAPTLALDGAIDAARAGPPQPGPPRTVALPSAQSARPRRPLLWVAALALGLLVAFGGLLAFGLAASVELGGDRPPLVPTPLDPVALAAPDPPDPAAAEPMLENDAGHPIPPPSRALRPTERRERAEPSAPRRAAAVEPEPAAPASPTAAPATAGPPPALVRATDLMGTGDFVGCLRELRTAGTSAPILGARMSCARSAGDHAELERTCDLLHQHHPAHAYARTCDTLLSVTP